MSPRPLFRRHRSLPLLLALSLLVAAQTFAAPIIRNIKDVNHNYGQVGEWLLIDGENFDGATTVVRFSKSGGGTVNSANVLNSTGRGMILCTVPATAVTGTVAVSVDGGTTFSTGYPFTVTAGTFTPGSSTVTGKVTGPSGNLANCAVLLLQPGPCDSGMNFWSCTLTNSLGNYTVNWPGSGSYFLFLFPPRSANLAGTALPITGTGNVVQNVALTAGTTVTGQIKNASAVGVSQAAVSWDGDSYDKVMTDASGNFSIHLPPGDWRMSVETPLNYHAIGIEEQSVTVPVSTPYAMGVQTLADGVWLSGTLQGSGGVPIVSGDFGFNLQGGGTWITSCTSGVGGAFGVEVPANTALQMNIQTHPDGPWVDSQQDIGPYSSDTSLGTITLGSAGFVKGTVRDDIGDPVPWVGLSAVHASSGTYLDWSESCEDGTYTLKVPSGGTTVPVRVTTSFWQDTRPYATQVYNDKEYLCEGDVINVTGTGTTTGVDFILHPGGSLSGTVTRYSGGTPLSGLQVVADDGTSHGCYLGGWPDTDGAGFYQIDHLPITPLRVWVLDANWDYGLSLGSYTNKIYPQYTPVTPTAGVVTPNINIALANPYSLKAVPDGRNGTTAAKARKLNADGTLVEGTWDVTTCPPPFNHDYNLIVGVGSTLPTYGIVASQCGLGRTGTFSGAMGAVPPGEKFLWFLVVQTGGNGSTESSWGRNSANNERAPGMASNQCEYTSKDSTFQCP